MLELIFPPPPKCITSLFAILMPLDPKRETLGTGCVEILELLLRSSPKKNFTQAGAHTVMTLEGIFRACRLDHVSVEASGVGRHLERGANHVFGRLVANFPLWVRAPPEFQFGLATCILDIFREIPGLLGQVASVEGTLSNIRICCPDDLVDDSERTFDEGGGSASESANAKRGSPVAKRPVIMSSLNRRERLHMRGYLWQMVRLLLEREVSQDAGDSLAQFVASCDDRRLVRPIVLLKLLFFLRCVISRTKCPRKTMPSTF